jgi:hypothetical protein
VIDILTKIIIKAKQHGYIKDIGNLEGDSLINLNLTDDILILLAANTKIVDALKCY